MKFGPGERPRPWSDDVEIDQVLVMEGSVWMMGEKIYLNIEDAVKAFCEGVR